MAYRKINYTPETLERRKEYQRRYARSRRQTPEGREYAAAAWEKTRAKLSTEEKKALAREGSFRHRSRQMGVCSDAAKILLAAGCKICGKKQSSKGRRVIVMDHDHTTGKFRGVLCSGCNTAIGQLKDDPKLVERALRYLLGEL